MEATFPWLYLPSTNVTENNGECQTVSFTRTEEILLLPILLVSVSEPEERDPEVFRYKFEECGKSWISLSVQNTYSYWTLHWVNLASQMHIYLDIHVDITQTLEKPFREL